MNAYINEDASYFEGLDLQNATPIKHPLIEKIQATAKMVQAQQTKPNKCNYSGVIYSGVKCIFSLISKQMILFYNFRIKGGFMNILKSCAIGLAVLLSVNASANNDTGLYSNDLAKCMVSSLSSSDKQIIQTATLQSMLAHPSFSHKNTYSAYEINQNSRELGVLFTRLMTEDCLDEFILAINYDNKDGVAGAFGTLASYAVSEIINHPTYMQKWEQSAKYIDTQKLEKAIKDRLNIR